MFATDLLDRELQAETRSQEGGFLLSEMAVTFSDYGKEILIQGAWAKEYHRWEKATKSYFNVNHARNGGAKPDWKAKFHGVGKVGSYVEKSQARLTISDATVPAGTLSMIDTNRNFINSAEHDDGYVASDESYRALVAAVGQFWDSLASQEIAVGKPHLPFD